MRTIRIFNFTRTAVAAAVAVAVSGSAFAEPSVLTDKSGMTVYTFDKDSAGKSACYGDCAAAWPPVAATGMAAGSDLSNIARDDGTSQAAYQGKPLYLFVGDRKPGDATGDNVQNVWHAVKPGTAKAAAKPAPAPAAYPGGY